MQLVLAVLLAAAQLSDQEVRARVQGYLGAIDTPVSAAHWRELGPRASAVLEEYAADEKTLPSVRAKAVDGLVVVGEGRVATLVPRLAQSDKEPLVVRLAAVRGLRHILSPARLVETLRPLLERAPMPALRAAAARELVRSDRAAGCKLVRAQAGREEERATLDEALAPCK